MSDNRPLNGGIMVKGGVTPKCCQFDKEGDLVLPVSFSDFFQRNLNSLAVRSHGFMLASSVPVWQLVLGSQTQTQDSNRKALT